MEPKKYDMFGISSLLFIIPLLYTFIKVKLCLGYKIFILILPFISYLCNICNDDICTTCDHLNIICISLSYLIISKYYNTTYTIILLTILEFIMSGKVIYSTMIAYIMLNYAAFNNFNHTQIIVGIVCLMFAGLSYMKRDCNVSTYPIYTTIWHTANSILLVMTANTLI